MNYKSTVDTNIAIWFEVLFKIHGETIELVRQM
jgi:hypothetical protein